MPIEIPGRSGAPLSAQDLDRLARLHVACLPRSLVSLLGPDYAARFYDVLQSSPDELLLVDRGDGGAIVGACLVSHRPASLSRRIAAGTPLLRHALIRPRALLALARAALGGGSPDPAGSDILLLFTDPASRGRGIASALVEAAVRAVAARGEAGLAVLTEDDPANEAVRFYLGRGFVRSGACRMNGQRFLRLSKDCGPGRA